VKVKILPAAQQDLLDGFHFYEQQAEGIGDYFLDALFSDIDSLMLYAGVHAIHFDNYHRMLSRRFPFAVYYRLEQDTAIVYAVLDCRRDPAWTRERFSE